MFVLAKSGKPLMPCHPARARKLLAKGRARVVRYVPFGIRLVDRDEGEVQPVRLKFDPGSKVTGMALVREADAVQHVLFLSELYHRGSLIRARLEQRAAHRRWRRTVNLRYRGPRFSNRTKPRGWLPPSLRSRVDNVLSWTKRLCRWCPVSSLSVERVRFDTQRLMNPEICGAEYQRGELFGFEVREYLLEKWGRHCAYCGVEGVPLQIEHIRAKARGGSDRVSNLTLACRPCNEAKGARPVEEFLAGDAERLAKVLTRAKAPLEAAATVNAARNALFFGLRAVGLPVEGSTGGHTKYNRARLWIPKTHALDAACVGELEAIAGWRQPVLGIEAVGRGSYQRTRLDRYGFPRGYLTRQKAVRGFQTGDLIEAVVPTGKKAGRYRGRVAVRSSGSFDVRAAEEVVQGIRWTRCRRLQRSDGYCHRVVVEF